MKTSSNRLALLLRTVTHLRPVQVFFRTRYAVRSRLQRHLPTVALRRDRFPGKVSWRPLRYETPFLAYPWSFASDTEQGILRFLNIEQWFGSRIDWNAEGKSRLWRYNLHYFQYLHPPGGLANDVALSLIRDWMDLNPPAAADAWDPFPVSLRIVNWIKFLSLHSSHRSASWDDIAQSIHAQTCSLESTLEYHLLGNHLFKNGKALLFAGLFFEGKDADRWLHKGLRILQSELDEQILPDGGHFERSPMYHSMILEDCLDLLNVCINCEDVRLSGLSARLENVVCSMVRFLGGMTHPDGQIALFNDAAFGIEPPPVTLMDYFRRVMKDINESPTPEVPWRPGGEAIKPFSDTGYYILSPGDGNRLIIDCGRIGPDYQPGHSHCDMLSFELSLKGRRVVVDSGCFQYEDGDMRRYNRGNPGHNTVTVDGENQSEVWGAHRCARRAQPIYAKVERANNGALLFKGAHDGYSRLEGSPAHHRLFMWQGDTLWIKDRVDGSGVHDIESRLHIHPDMVVNGDGDGVTLRDRGVAIASVSPVRGGKVERVKGWYCPEFGKKFECTVLRVRQRQVRLPYRGGWVFRNL